MKKEELLPSLKSFEIFQQVPENQLFWLIENSELRSYEPGDTIFKPGDPIDNTLIVLKGSFKIVAFSEKQEIEIATKSVGEISGFLPFSRAKAANGNSKVMEPTLLLCLNRSFERELLRDHYELSQVLVHEMTSRVREFTGLQKQTEKLAALGKLSAGLAHELNNPASAIVRSAQELKKHLRLQPDKFKKVIKVQMTDDLIEKINFLLFNKIQNVSPQRGLLKMKELEDDLFFFLEDLEVSEAMEVAENLAEFGFEIRELQDLATHLRKEDLGPIFNWIADNLVLEKMVNDIHESSERISNLVQSVKSYTHMDQSQGIAEADLHGGILTTLNILNHKIKNSNTQIELDFDPTIPHIPLFISEINQVWTNLIDNAIDAMEGSANPKLIVRTRNLEKEIQICLIDNGPGIPDEIASRIWEPFFTTKEMGKGTGLGLELVKDIINKHHGSISLKSKPGNTSFEVLLPTK